MRNRNERGAVTAEAAAVIPVLILVGFGLCWLVSLGVAQVRTVDAAREAARALARQEDPERAVALARRVAPAGAEVRTGTDDGLVTVSVQSPAEAPGGLFRFPVFRARATAVAALETVPSGSG